MSMRLRISHIECQSVQIMTLHGYLAQLEVYKLKRMIEEAIQDGRRYIVIDLRQVDFIDSAGIGVLLHLRKECAQAQGRSALVVRQPSGVSNVLTSANLFSIFCVHARPEDALEEMLTTTGIAGGAVAEGLAAQIQQLTERLFQLEQRLGIEHNHTRA